jgi:hypothetical protein
MHHQDSSGRQGSPPCPPGFFPLDLPTGQVAILRGDLTGWIAGIEEDLGDPLELPDRDAATREAEAFRRLLVAVESGEIVLPDKDARSAMGRAAEGYEEAAGYERAVATHDAHHALLDLLGGADRERGCIR